MAENDDPWPTSVVQLMAQIITAHVSQTRCPHRAGNAYRCPAGGLNKSVIGERELALGMADYAQRSLGLSVDNARRVMQGLRVSGEAANRRTEPWQLEHRT